MERLPFRTGTIAVIVAALVALGAPVRADDVAPPAPVPAVVASPAPVPVVVTPASAGPSVVLARLAADPRTPDGYSANLELHVKLRSFPFIGLTVHGTSTYRRPGQYHYLLQNVPRIAGRFDDLHYDLGDPVTWSQKYEITMAPQSTDNEPVLRLTPKHPGVVIALDIATDARHGRMLEATWRRKDGGTIVLTQTYAAVGAVDVVTQQHAVIDIPHMRAELTANYTNVTIDTPTFAAVTER